MKKTYVLTAVVGGRVNELTPRTEVVCVVTAESVEDAAGLLSGTVEKTSENSGKFFPGNGTEDLIAFLHHEEFEEVLKMMQRLRAFRLNHVPHLQAPHVT